MQLNQVENTTLIQSTQPTSDAMLLSPQGVLRPSKARGYAKRDWLESYHSFSFADYFDRRHMHFSVLRVINEDVIAPARGFGMHPHHDMEIITYMLSGELQHQDSLGNGSVIRAGDVQRMTAGSGIVHSEVNASATEAAHLLQIWLMPNAVNLSPSYEEKQFTQAEKCNQWRLVASEAGENGALKVHQDIQLWATILDAQQMLPYTLNVARSAYLQVAKGQVSVNGQVLVAGDALMYHPHEHPQQLNIEASTQAELLLFDLPKDPRATV